MNTEGYGLSIDVAISTSPALKPYAIYFSITPVILYSAVKR
jgi:hypothetical protein